MIQFSLFVVPYQDMLAYREFHKKKEEIMGLKKIMNPVDGSEHSRRATIYACELARLVNAEIILLYCHRKFPVILAEPYFQDAVNQIIKESEI